MSDNGDYAGQPHETFSAWSRAEFRRDLEARFWRYVRRTDGGCWLWRGSINRRRGGYGQIAARGVTGKLRVLKAHRVSWLLHNGAVPDGLFVCHHCDTPRCVNPDHLFLGTHTDNMRDASSKHRLSAPRPTGQKVSDGDVHLMRLWRTQGVKLSSIAAQFDVTRAFVSLVVRGLRRQFAKPFVRESKKEEVC